MTLASTSDAHVWDNASDLVADRVGGVEHVTHEHDHHDDAPHGHHHGHVHKEAQPPVVPSRAVMINIGETTGALILDSTPARSGVEVEIHPVSEPTQRQHVWVLPREGRDGVIYAAVFPTLATGDYAVLNPDDSLAMVISVPPNKVTHASWG